jgi:hypothetical protein
MTSSSASTPTALNLGMIQRACWIGTKFVGIAVNDQRGRIPLGDMGRGSSLTESIPHFGIARDSLVPILPAVVGVEIQRGQERIIAVGQVADVIVGSPSPP